MKNTARVVVSICGAVAACLISACQNAPGSTDILIVPNVVTQGKPSECASYDQMAAINAAVEVPKGGAAPKLQAASSNPKISVTLNPISTGQTPSKTGEWYQFGFSCSERGIEGTVTISDPAGHYPSATATAICLNALEIAPSQAPRNMLGLVKGGNTKFKIETDPASGGKSVAASVADGAGIIQLTPSSLTTASNGSTDRFTVACLQVGNGKIEIRVPPPPAGGGAAASPEHWQELLCEVHCHEGE